MLSLMATEEQSAFTPHTLASSWGGDEDTHDETSGEKWEAGEREAEGAAPGIVGFACFQNVHPGSTAPSSSSLPRFPGDLWDPTCVVAEIWRIARKE